MARKKGAEASLAKLEEECEKCNREMEEIDKEIYERTEELFIRKKALAARICHLGGELMRHKREKPEIG